MATKILFAPRQSEVILDIARSLTPPGFELVVSDVGTAEFYQAALDAEYYLGLARQMGGEFFRAAPKLRLVQLLSAGYDRVDAEAARKAGVPVANNGGANAVAVAEHTLMLMLAVLKRLVRLHNDVVAGRWRASDPGDPPAPHHPLPAQPTVTLTPHSAGPTWGHWTPRFRNGFDNIQRVAAGGRPRWVIAEVA